MKLLISIDKQLEKIKRISPYSIAVFDRLSLVVLIGDYYQLAPIWVKPLWDNLVGKEEVYGKSFWGRFTLVLMQIEQICLKIDIFFQDLLKRAREENLDSRDVSTMNQRLGLQSLTSGFLNTVIIVQKNKSRYLVKQLHIESFV